MDGEMRRMERAGRGKLDWIPGGMGQPSLANLYLGDVAFAMEKSNAQVNQRENKSRCYCCSSVPVGLGRDLGGGLLWSGCLDTSSPSTSLHSAFYSYNKSSD